MVFHLFGIKPLSKLPKKRFQGKNFWNWQIFIDKIPLKVTAYNFAAILSRTGSDFIYMHISHAPATENDLNIIYDKIL